MPVPIREQALAAFFNLFNGLTAYPLKVRMTNQVLPVAAMPYLLQLDGGSGPLSGDDASSGYSGVVRVGLRVSVVIGVRPRDPTELSTLLSQGRADVIKAVMANPTLGGLVDNVRWDGEDDPVQSDEAGAPPHGIFSINFVIVHTEAELDPFSAM